MCGVRQKWVFANRAQAPDQNTCVSKDAREGGARATELFSELLGDKPAIVCVSADELLINRHAHSWRHRIGQRAKHHDHDKTNSKPMRLQGLFQAPPRRLMGITSQHTDKLTDTNCNLWMHCKHSRSTIPMPHRSTLGCVCWSRCCVIFVVRLVWRRERPHTCNIERWGQGGVRTDARKWWCAAARVANYFPSTVLTCNCAGSC